MDRWLPKPVAFHTGFELESFFSAPISDSKKIGDWLCDRLDACGLPGCVNPSNEKYFLTYYADGSLSKCEAAILADAVAAALVQGKPVV